MGSWVRFVFEIVQGATSPTWEIKMEFKMEFEVQGQAKVWFQGMCMLYAGLCTA